MADTALAPQRVSLRDLTEELTTYRDTLEGLVDDDGPDATLIRAKLAQIESLHEHKVDRYAAFLHWLVSEQAQLKADKQRFERRQKAYTRMEDQLRSRARDMMRENGIPQMKGRCTTISLCPGRVKLEISDPQQIPQKYLRHIPAQVIPEQWVPDEAAISDALQVNEEVPGARFVDGEPFIQVR